MAALFADCGCLSKDTVIPVSRGGAGMKITIEKLYKMFHGPKRKADISVRSLTGESIRLHKIKNVIQSGVKPVYELKLEDGKSVKATEDHEIRCAIGWIPLGKLTLNDFVMVDNLSRYQKMIINKILLSITTKGVPLVNTTRLRENNFPTKEEVIRF
jgi:hypothetical protein